MSYLRFKGSGGLEAALNRLLPEVRRKADLVILLSQFDVEKTQALVKAVKGVDVAISSGGDDVFYATATENEKTMLLQTGSKGKTLGLLKVTLDETQALRVIERRYVPLDNSVPDNGAVAKLIEPFKKVQVTNQEEIRKGRTESLQLSPQEFMERYRKRQTEKGKGEAR